MNNDYDKGVVFPMVKTLAGTFNAGPLLKVLNNFGPSDIAKVLDEAIHELTKYYLDHNGNHTDASSNLYCIMHLRNALLEGADIIYFNDK